MAFTDHKITQFQHRIADLPDQPNMPSDELKARFDSSPEELRQSVNAICDEGEALTARVDHHDTQINQIAMDKFPDDTIHEKNLHPDLAAKLNAKADETALSAAVNTLEAADAAETAAREALSETVAQKCEIFLGSYTGYGGTNYPISLGFRPKAVFLCAQNGYVGFATGSFYSYGGLMLDGKPLKNNGYTIAEITDSGFKAYQNESKGICANESGMIYHYIAFR